ncbi:MAG: alginate export family protein [Halioglobus sp.]
MTMKILNVSPARPGRTSSATVVHGRIEMRAFLVFSLLALASTAFSQTSEQSAGQAEQSSAGSLSDMITQGKVNLNFRYRYEYVDQDGFDRDAKASTLRSRLTAESGNWKGISLLGEVDNVTYLGSEKFNNTDNGKTNYPVVADPEGTDLNQLLISYTGAEATGTYGRQRILHGNQRFVGGVAWRQNEQTYDGLRAVWTPDASGLSIDYAYVYNVNRLFGPDDTNVQPADLSGDNHFLRLDYQLSAPHTVTAFAYLFDVEDRERFGSDKSVDNSTDTYGVEYAGSWGPVKLDAAYAWQTDAGDSGLDYSASYYRAELKSTFSGVTGRLGYEVLGSDNSVGFKTPYATLHKFQGWADLFLTTPEDGIEDLYVGVSGNWGRLALEAVYHDFQAESGSADFGNEIDLMAGWRFSDVIAVQLHYADFSTDSPSRFADTRKAWFTLALAF